MRHIEVDAASAPKDVKIAALERTSQESEKLILQARNERLKHMDELHLAQKKYAELEGKIRDRGEIGGKRCNDKGASTTIKGQGCRPPEVHHVPKKCHSRAACEIRFDDGIDQWRRD